MDTSRVSVITEEEAKREATRSSRRVEVLPGVPDKGWKSLDAAKKLAAKWSAANKGNVCFVIKSDDGTHIAATMIPDQAEAAPPAGDEPSEAGGATTETEQDMKTKKKGRTRKSSKAPARKGESRRTQKREGGPSGLDLAATVLSRANAPLNAKTITERVLAAGWKTKGKTPHATISAAIQREIADKGKDARFKKADRGLFTTA